MEGDVARKLRELDLEYRQGFCSFFSIIHILLLSSSDKGDEMNLFVWCAFF